MHTAEPVVLGLSASEIEVSTGKLIRYESPSVDHIPTELIQTGGETLRSEIQKLITLQSNSFPPFPTVWSKLVLLSYSRLVPFVVI
jgi:hypothetical protein